ncbi:DUF1320 family protein [Hymenobacter sp. BT664]|uniref:DUF1320 family protein n=1 Tax=Hymenobacter montanus TaxID=2771359 RepID=A0A927BGF0_9BACT|nr:phage protein Gp36 family protein [Hymenobacter montanus]MBD2769714.1 DUF1320 family protein [Hymenobacter montanus]
MSFIKLSDYSASITARDLQSLLSIDEPDPTLEPLPEDQDDDGDPDPDPAPAPAVSLREEAEANAMTEVASYLRGRYDMEVAFAATGTARNKQLVRLVVDVALWNLCPRVAFANVSEIRETRYKAAIAWLTMAQRGLSNPDLPAYAPDPEKPQGRMRFRYGSNPRRSQSF